MKTWKWALSLVLVISISLLAVVDSIQAQEVDNTIYAELLDTYLHGDRVDYEGLKREQDKLDRYLDHLSGIDPENLSRDEQLAYYINVYNAWTLKLIIMNYPGIESIKDLGSSWNPFATPWKKKFVELKDKTVHLDYIEHEIIRPRFQDPRIHFAVNCTALSCPPLLEDPYAGDTINEQLDFVTRQFLNDTDHNYMEGTTLYVTRLFDWYGGDFGGTDESKIDFILKYADPELSRKIKENRGRIDLEYLNYNWSLNDAKKS